MRTGKLKIGTQMIIGFALILFLVAVLGANSFWQAAQLHNQTEVMYNHPVRVRKALNALIEDTLAIQISHRDLLLAKSDSEKQESIRQMKVSSSSIENQFNILRDWYLGPPSDIEDAVRAYIVWITATEANTELALSGDTEKAILNIKPEGTITSYRDLMWMNIDKISTFAFNKTDELYNTSINLNTMLNMQLILLLSIILLASFFISYKLLKNIRKPLKEINDAVTHFHNGDMDARSTYRIGNEFGVLSSSINLLADKVRENFVLNNNTMGLAQIMLGKEDARTFFRMMLSALAEYTDSQIAAVYLLSDDRNSYVLFESIGADGNAKKSFAAEDYEGEFGAVLLTRKIQHIKDISDDARFVFHTVSGSFIPREILTIPILSGDSIVAVISLASVKAFAPQALDLINSILITMSTRIEGILAFEKIKAVQQKLEQQNRELDIQGAELTAQAAELIMQNSELEAQKNQLDEASRMKTSFLSNMSHELRTPLNSVIALSGVLGRKLAGQIPEEEYRYLDVIERNGKSLLRLINDILDISRIEAGHEEMEITTFGIDQLIAEVTAMIKPQATLKSIELIRNPVDAALVISSDADKCRHILQNMLSNAIKFTEKGKVTVTARNSADHIEIIVSDTGIGISAEQVPHIFDEFRQADSSTSRRYGGSGLGLAIAKKYANLLGGSISVRSEPNEGSEFTLFLPLNYTVKNIAAAKERSITSKVDGIPAPLRPDQIPPGKTMLLVDDNEAAVIQTRDLLEEMGIRVQVARDAHEALEVIKSVIPDAMMIDLMMPEMDGFKLLEILRNAEPTANVPVLILTAKYISKEELKFLKRNNIHQLIRKGDTDRAQLQSIVYGMLFPAAEKTAGSPRNKILIAGKPTVLVTEDNPDNMTTVKALIDSRFNVLEAKDAYECLEAAEKAVPDLILMDIALSGKSGIDAFLEIRKNPRLQHIPVIALTATAMEHERETILSFGFDAFIAKPIIEKQFFDVIDEVLYGK